jgi:hypothetical protein
MTERKIFNPRNIPSLLCPSCQKEGTLHKSKTKNLKESLLRILFFWGFYRCWECNWRGLVLNKTLTMPSVKRIMLYLLLAICSSLLVLLILKVIIG